MLCHGEQKANSHNSGKNGLKIFVVIVVIYKQVPICRVIIYSNFIKKLQVCLSNSTVNEVMKW